MSARTLAVLGATGTVGRSTLDLARRHRDRLEVHALTAHRDGAALLALCREFEPALAVLGDPSGADELRRQVRAAGLRTEVRAGPEALAEAASAPGVDRVMSAIVGGAGLVPTLAAVRAGKCVLIANKEPLVMAGRLLLAEADRHGATLIPIDSEHNAIFQCLPDRFRCGRADPGVRRLVLTASGGPFRETPVAELRRVTPAQAVRHPNWVMGPKISVDSATMMNKGLELIEARWLFGVPEERIEVVLHPESRVHSLVEYVDGSLLAHLGQPDMRVPIAHALAWPERWESGVEPLALADLGSLRFGPVDLERYPCLRLAREALRAGGVMPIVLNGANEVAVESFLGGSLPFTAIAEVIERTLEAAPAAGLPGDDSLDAVLAVDRWSRARARHAAGGGEPRAVGRA